MTADVLQRALRARHAGDFYVSECKDGSSTTRNHLQLDGWALLNTWSPVTTIGYEIKVSRSDFLRDVKLPAYLPLCHLLFVVAPKGLLKPEEIPEHVGLIEALSQKDSQMPAPKLVTRKRAVRREIEIPTNLLLYVLMYRADPTSSRYGAANRDPASDRSARWRDAIANRQHLGYLVRAAIREEWDALKRRAGDAEAKVQTYDAVRARMRELGLDPDKSISRWALNDMLARAMDIVTPERINQVRAARASLEAIERGFDELRSRRDEAQSDALSNA